MRQEGNSGGGSRNPRWDREKKQATKTFRNAFIMTSLPFPTAVLRASPLPSFIGSELAFQEPGEAISPLISMPFLLQNTELVSRPTEKPG